MATRWSKKSNSNNNNSAPTTIFSNALSPRQLANKTITLGYKKLDRDSKRQRPQYNFRIQVLITNTIAEAENVLNKRTRRTNRRVMAAEEEEEEDFVHMIKNRQQKNDGSMTISTTTTTVINKGGNNDGNKKNDPHHHSPLRSCSSSLAKDQQQLSSSATTEVSTSLSTKMTKDYMNDRKVQHHKKHEGTDDHNKKDGQATTAGNPMTEPSCHNHSSIPIVASPTSLSRDCKPIVIQSVTTPIESII